MTVEQATALVQRLQSDPEFRQRLESADHADKRAVLESGGYGDVKLADVSRALPSSAGGELTDQEFEAVSGGVGSATGVSLAVGTGYTVAIGAAVGALAF